MKSILMSIKPKWIEKIASGEKTVEVRKSVPKCETPFKVYMYCTNPKLKTVQIIKKGESIYGDMLHTEETPLFIKTYADADEALYSMFKSGKVVGEFVCDGVRPFEVQSPAYWYLMNKAILEQACLTKEELHDYIGAGNLAYGLHISNLKIYDKPKELSEFHKPLRCGNFKCAKCGYWIHRRCNIDWSIKRPPQSWQYVEEQGVER